MAVLGDHGLESAIAAFIRLFGLAILTKAQSPISLSPDFDPECESRWGLFLNSNPHKLFWGTATSDELLSV